MQSSRSAQASPRPLAGEGGRRRRPGEGVMSHRQEKLNYMSNNPVKPGWVREPSGWPWSSWSFYFRRDASIPKVDRWDEPPAKTRPFGKSQTP